MYALGMSSFLHCIPETNSMKLWSSNILKEIILLDLRFRENTDVIVKKTQRG